MGAIKHYLHERDEEEQMLYEALMDYLEENEEMFRGLSHPNPEEVIGYEE